MSASACEYGDLAFCTCQDGDTCHYKGLGPMPAPLKPCPHCGSASALHPVSATACADYEDGLLDWLQENEYSLTTHRERDGDGGFTIWWVVVTRAHQEQLTHPYGNPRDAIRAAMKSK